MSCIPDGMSISITVGLTSGVVVWGPAEVNSSETIRALKLKVAESLGTSEKCVQLIKGEQLLDPMSSVGSLCTVASDGVPVIKLTAIVGCWRQEVSRVLFELLELSQEKLGISDDHGRATDTEIILLLEEIALTCGSLPEEVAVWLELLLGSGKVFSLPDMGGCFGRNNVANEAPHYNKGNTRGLLYFGSFYEEDSIIVLWIDLFGEFGEIFGLQPQTCRGFVWSTGTDIDEFDHLLNLYSTVGCVRSMPSLELWQSWLTGGRVLEPEQNYGCPVYPECLASSLTDFFQRMATSGRMPRWGTGGVTESGWPEYVYDEKAILDGLPGIQHGADSTFFKVSRESAKSSRVRPTFDMLDKNNDGTLSSSEMQVFAELTGLLPTLAFGLTDAQIASNWSTTFVKICADFGVRDVNMGLDFNTFVSFSHGMNMDYVNENLRAGIEPPSGGHWRSKEDQQLWEAVNSVNTHLATTMNADEFLCFQSAVVADNQIICFAPCDATTVLSYNVATREIDGIDITAIASGSQKFDSAFYVQGKVLMVPKYANKLLVCDLEKNEVRGVNILHSLVLQSSGLKERLSPNLLSGGFQKVKASCVAGKTLVMVPEGNLMEERLLIWDLETEGLIKDIDINDAVGDCAQKGRVFTNDIFMIVVEDKVVVVPTEADRVLICDLTTHAVEAIDISAVEDPTPPQYYSRYVKACFAAGKVVAVPLAAAQLLICDLATKEARGVDVSTVSTGDDRFCDAVVVGDKIIAVPGDGDAILVFDAAKNKLRGVDVTSIATGELKFSSGCCVADGKVFAAPRSSGKMLVFDVETEVARGIDASGVMKVDGTEGEWDFNTLCATSSTVVMAHDWGHLLLVYDIGSELFSVVDTLKWLPSTHWLAPKALEAEDS